MFDSNATGRQSASDFVEQQLRSEPELSFAEVRERAAEAGLMVPAFLYGSTRRRLGLEAPAAGAGAGRDADDSADTGEPTGAGDDAAGNAAGNAEGDAEHEVEDEAGPRASGAGRAAADAAAARPGATASRGASFQFALDTLRMSPEISFQDLKARAALENLDVKPIHYGRAKALLGLVPTRPRRKRAAREAAPGTTSHGPAARDAAASGAAPSDAAPFHAAVDAGQAARTGARQPQRRAGAAAEPELPLPSLDGIRSIENLVATVRALDEERRRLRETLQAVLDCVEDALQAE